MADFSVVELAVVVATIVAGVNAAVQLIRTIGPLVKAPRVKLDRRRIIVTAASVALALFLFFWLGRTSEPRVEITSPLMTVRCLSSAEEPACRFTVSGTATGLDSGDLVAVFVFPIEPPGGGWFIQQPLASVDRDGQWLQDTHLGTGGFAVQGGDVLEIRVAIVTNDANVGGVLLAEEQATGVIEDLRQVTGTRALSPLVKLTVAQRGS